MKQTQTAIAIPGYRPGKKALLVFFETDCPTCQLALPYFNGLAGDSLQVIALSQDDEARTQQFVKQMGITYPVELDRGLKLSRSYDPQSVPTSFLLDEDCSVMRSLVGFDKAGLNDLAAAVVAGVPPCYGEATVEKIAANAVMAGCRPEMMRVLVPLVRALCDESFNAHGVQATTHFAAPLVIINGPVRQELGFWSRQNVFSNVARANSTLGRALQLILLNMGGARPDGIDMSALGNPGKFASCIAENEEENLPG